MRITGGQARGRVLRAPVKQGVRPTSSRVREALFSMVGQDLTGIHVVDAFGGTGLLGFEAWSRGATVTIVEKRGFVAKQIKQTAAELGATVNVRVGDALRLLPELQAHGVLADPPYALEPETLLPVLGAATEWLMYEADARRTAPSRAGDLVLDRERTFGGTSLWLYRPERS